MDLFRRPNPKKYAYFTPEQKAEADRFAAEFASPDFFPHWVDGLSNDVYHCDVGVSSSIIKGMRRSALHFLHKMNNPMNKTKSMEIGTLIHAAILEPELLGTEFISDKPVLQFAHKLFSEANKGRISKKIRGTDAYKKALEEFSGQHLISDEIYQNALGAMKAFYAHGTAPKLLQRGKAEVSGLWIDEETGLPLKVRNDYLRKDRVIVDIKSTDNAQPYIFKKKIYDFGYHVSAGMYLDAAEIITGEVHQFVWVVIESSEPYGIALYTPDDQMLQTGRKVYRKGLNEIAQCLESGKFEGYPAKVRSISLPDYAYNP